ncbi:MAG: glycosyltransferase family 4 protein, partial [Anaerolineae bacterium]|nr:glycosyltransferase family 4 protein [Anaerolineae bacterium]
MLLSNAFRPDPRVAREAQALAEAGHEVTVVCWDRMAELAPHQALDGYTVERVSSAPSRYGAGARQLLRLPRFWRQAAHRVRTLKPQVVHCHDLDTLPAGWWLKRQTGARLVYDAHEDYPALMSLYLPAALVRALSWLEQRLLSQVDYTITASTVFAEKLQNWGIERVITVGNYSSLASFDAISAAEVLAERSRLGIRPEDYVVAYIGGFTRNRLLLPLIEAARGIPDVQLFLWGDGHQRAAIEAAIADVPNARYLGWLPQDQVPLCTCLADVIYYCLLPDYPGAVYNAPNTLSNAMAAGRPIIANSVGDLGRIVSQVGCGVLLTTVTAATIREAIDALRDPKHRARLGSAGQAAAKSEYNWAAAARRLAHVYDQLLGRG